MITQKLASRLQSKYADKIASTLGMSAPPSDMSVVVLSREDWNSRFGASARGIASGHTVYVPDDVDSADAARLIAYETAHGMTMGPGASTALGAHGLTGSRAGKASEAISGVITEKLGLQPSNWAASARQQRFMNLEPKQLASVVSDIQGGTYQSIKQSTGGAVPKPVIQGGGGGAPSGNTNANGGNNNLASVINNASTIKYKNPGGLAALPSLSPANTANEYQQLIAIQQQYLLSAQAARAQRVGLRAGFKSTAAGIKANEVSGIVGQENSAISRGVVGSSGDLGQRVGIRAGAAAEMAGAKSDLLLSLANNRLGVQQAGLTRETGLLNLEANVLAQKQTDLATMLQNNLIVSGQETSNDILKQIIAALQGGAGGGGGAGTGSDTSAAQLMAGYTYNPYPSARNPNSH